MIKTINPQGPVFLNAYVNCVVTPTQIMDGPLVYKYVLPDSTQFLELKQIYQ